MSRGKNVFLSRRAALRELKRQKQLLWIASEITEGVTGGRNGRNWRKPSEADGPSFIMKAEVEEEVF
jgi:hypothetical protein